MDVIKKKTKKSKKYLSLVGLIVFVIVGAILLIISCSKPIEVVNQDEFDYVQIQHGNRETPGPGNKAHQYRDDISETTYKAHHEDRTVKKENKLVEELFGIGTSSKKMAERNSSDLMNVMYVSESVKQIALKYQLTELYELSNWVSAHAKGILLEELEVDEKEYQEVMKELEMTTREQWENHK